MTKLRIMLSAAAALIVGGASVGVALRQAAIAKAVSCKEWNRGVHAWSGSETLRAVVAVKSGSSIPKTVGDRLLGDCIDGACSIKPDYDCAMDYTYEYTLGPAVNLGAEGTWRIAEVLAPAYILGGWKRAARADPAHLRFFGGFGEAMASCLTVTTGTKCLALFDAGNRCWLLDDETTCDHGRLYGPGRGGDAVCVPTVTSKPKPCVAAAGMDSYEATRVITDAEME